MTTATIEQVERDVMTYLRKVQAGESVIITQADKPVAEIRPIPPTTVNGTRPFGLAKGQIWIADDFDAPLPEDILRDFEA